MAEPEHEIPPCLTPRQVADVLAISEDMVRNEVVDGRVRGLTRRVLNQLAQKGMSDDG